MPPSCIDEGRTVAFAVGDWNAALDPVVPIGSSLDNDTRVPADDFRLLIVGLRRTTSLAQAFQRDQRNIRFRLPVPTAMRCFLAARLARTRPRQPTGPHRVLQCPVSDAQRSNNRDAATPAYDRDGMDAAPFLRERERCGKACRGASLVCHSGDSSATYLRSEVPR